MCKFCFALLLVGGKGDDDEELCTVLTGLNRRGRIKRTKLHP